MGGGGGAGQTDQRSFIQTKRCKKTRACIVVQRMTHHNHPIHLNYPDLFFVNYGDKTSQGRYLSTCTCQPCLSPPVPPHRKNVVDSKKAISELIRKWSHEHWGRGM